MFADDEVLLQLGLEGPDCSLEVGKAPVLGGQGDSLHGLKLWSRMSERVKTNEMLLKTELVILT